MPQPGPEEREDSERVSRGGKLVEVIQKQFDEFEELGFCGFAVGFYHQKQHVVSTAEPQCITPECVEYLQALLGE